jgi:CRP/FNR family transcriptional regulator, cyclic AMP receptor protein
MIHTEWRRIALLAEAEEEVISAFNERAWPVSYAEGEAVIWEGDVCEAVYFIASGMVEVYRTAVDGRAHTLRVLHAGDSFNLGPALLQDGKHKANVRCLPQTDLQVMKKKDLKAILVRFPKFSLRVLEDLAARLANMTELAGDLALKNVRQRTASFLIGAAETKNRGQNRRWTQDEMARQIGTVRDVVGRTLREFEEQGLIKRDRGNIQLLDRDGLEKKVNGLE